MKDKHITLIVVTVITILVLAACGSASNDVPSLKTVEDTPMEASNADVADPILENEAMMITFTECMRDEGIELLDPVVDSEGNVQKPEFVEGVEVDGKALKAASEVCAHHLEGFTFERKRVDMSEQVDRFVALATCLRDKGYDVDDPTAETLDQWGADFKARINWKDPAAMADYEECSGDADAEGNKK